MYLQQVEQVGDRLQRVVDLMGDAGRQPARSCKLLGLAKRLFRAKTVRDVHHDHANPADCIVVRLHRVEMNRPRALFCGLLRHGSRQLDIASRLPRLEDAGDIRL